MTSIPSGADNDAAIYENQDNINDSMQQFNPNKKSGTCLSDQTLYWRNLGEINKGIVRGTCVSTHCTMCQYFCHLFSFSDTVDLGNNVKECLSRVENENHLNMKNIIHAFLNLVSIQNSVSFQDGQNSLILSKDADLNFRDLFLEMKKNLLAQYHTQKTLNQLFFQSIKDSRDIAATNSVDRNSLFQNIFNTEYKQILEKNKRNEKQDLATFYDCVKKTAKYFRTTSTPDVLSYHATNSENATVQPSFTDKHPNYVNETGRHKHVSSRR
jgi:hypothetical protein